MTEPTRNKPITTRIEEAGRRFAAIQDAIGVSSKDARAMDGVTHSTWSNWRAGRRKIDPLQIQKYCEYYGITLDYIFYGNRARLPHEIIAKLAENPD